MATKYTSATFCACTGYGSAGRAVTLRTAENEFSGDGATDEEAILEALMHAGLSFDAAFDLTDETLRSVTVHRDAGCPK